MVHSKAQLSVPTWCCMTACAGCAAGFYSSCSAKTAVECSGSSLQSRVGQSIVERSGWNPAELTSFYVVADYRTAASRVFTRSDAALFVAGALGWPWKAARLMRFVPQAVRDRAYDIVARSRYRVFGRYDRCLAPSPEFRRRFIDV